MKTLEYNSKRLAKRIRILMKESPNTTVSPNTNTSKNKQPVLLTQQVIDF